MMIMKYRVTVEAVVRKTFDIEAESSQEAQEEANEIFTVANDGGEEYYRQEAIDIEEMDP
jgi:hypothetical protein